MKMEVRNRSLKALSPRKNPPLLKHWKIQQNPQNKPAGTLVAYFSWSGNTAQMAQMIQTETGGDLFEIQPAVPYTGDYDTLLDVAQQEQRENARPELASQVENWDSYDVVFVGYPDWWSDAPMLIYSFLESYDWNGKTLVPFCTSGGQRFWPQPESVCLTVHQVQIFWKDCMCLEAV